MERLYTKSGLLLFNVCPEVTHDHANCPHPPGSGIVPQRHG
jgi:hypothetical protein